ncbi:MAG: hypothetical protein WC282_01880 [Bacilli bacterium]|jgi:hypothetical protein
MRIKIVSESKKYLFYAPTRLVDSWLSRLIIRQSKKDFDKEKLIRQLPMIRKELMILKKRVKHFTLVDIKSKEGEIVKIIL